MQRHIVNWEREGSVNTQKTTCIKIRTMRVTSAARRRGFLWPIYALVTIELVFAVVIGSWTVALFFQLHFNFIYL